MLDKDKLWLVFHLDVSTIDNEEDYVEFFRKGLKYDDSVQVFVVPEHKSVEHPVEVLQTPCVLFPNLEIATISTKRLDD